MNSNAQECWRPSQFRRSQTQMWSFMQHIAAKYGIDCNDYNSLHQFSIDQSDSFWSELLTYFEVHYQGNPKPVNTDKRFNQYGWFPKIELNFAENLLAKGTANETALISILENGFSKETNYAELRHQVASFQSQIENSIGEDDVLACYMPNVSETVISMLATTALGGVFTSTSSDFGIEGVIDRFSQSKPKVLVAAAGYFYGGKYFDCMAKISEVVAKVPSIVKVFIVDVAAIGVDLNNISNTVLWSLSDNDDNGSPAEPYYVNRKFSAPLYIMYSSGTTGKPKCIVHSVGGTLLQHIKELGLHCDVSKGKRIFYFTTCGWMMWNWLVSSLYFGGSVVLYDGSPGHPTLFEFFKIVERLEVNIFGTSPKFLRTLEDQNIDFSEVNLDKLETILSTGSPLLPEQYDYVYNNIKADVMLASIAGGTDILGCFFGGNPVLPVYRGELQSAGLGMDVACVDDQGKTLIEQEGELVCRQSFPSRPIYFLNDKDNQKLNSAYFNRFKGVWHHGDYILITNRGGAKFLGRSDATLNPGGVRIGTSEIYRQTEPLPYIEDSVCVGKKIEGDDSVLLFVKLVEGETLTDERVREIKKQIRSKTTPRHVPAAIYQVRDIPYTRSGKKIEGVVANIINNRKITNIEAISNPKCLDEYKQYS